LSFSAVSREHGYVNYLLGCIELKGKTLANALPYLAESRKAGCSGDNAYGIVAIAGKERVARK
jgi:hypothetical protein